MAEFNLQVRVDSSELDDQTLEEYLLPYVAEHENVSVAETDDADSDSVESTLEIEGIDTFGELYVTLRDADEALELGLWGPTAERFPVPVQHYALQQISNPDAYEFHAIDNKVTLVISDSQHHVEQLRQEVPPPALG